MVALPLALKLVRLDGLPRLVLLLALPTAVNRVLLLVILVLLRRAHDIQTEAEQSRRARDVVVAVVQLEHDRRRLAAHGFLQPAAANLRLLQVGNLRDEPEGCGRPVDIIIANRHRHLKLAARLRHPREQVRAILVVLRLAQHIGVAACADDLVAASMTFVAHLVGRLHDDCAALAVLLSDDALQGERLLWQSRR